MFILSTFSFEFQCNCYKKIVVMKVQNYRSGSPQSSSVDGCVFLNTFDRRKRLFFPETENV